MSIRSPDSYKPDKLDPLLRAADVAQLLAVSRSSAYRLLREGQIPVVKFGEIIRVRRSDIEAFIERSLQGGA